MSFKKTKFPNGLTLVTEKLTEFRSLSIGVWAKVGTRHETPQEAGVSHFLEHMLFKGTNNRSALDIAREVDRVGGEFNAFTAREHTCFHLLLLDRDLGLGIDILRDVLLESKFDSQELERERKVILQEISMVEEAPEELAQDLFAEKVYGGHALGRPILGTERSIRNLSRARILDFFKRHYRPDQLVVAVAGNVSHEAVKKKLGALLKKKWPDRPEKKAKAPVSPAPDPVPGAWWVVRPTEQVHLVWGVKAPKIGAKDRIAAFLMNIYLGGGMSSALFQEIREKNGLAYTVYSMLSGFEDTGLFSIYAATGMNQVALCLKLIEGCVGRLQDQVLTDDELEIVKENVKGTLLLSNDNVESRMSNIARNELVLGTYETPEEVCKEIDRVTPEQIRRLARKMFSDPKRSLLALGPKPKASLKQKFKFQVSKR